jgi:hypothetical protein
MCKFSNWIYAILCKLSPKPVSYGEHTVFLIASNKRWGNLIFCLGAQSGCAIQFLLASSGFRRCHLPSAYVSSFRPPRVFFAYSPGCHGPGPCSPLGCHSAAFFYARPPSPAGPGYPSQRTHRPLPNTKRFPTSVVDPGWCLSRIRIFTFRIRIFTFRIQGQ